ncbi:MAG TPA: glycosyltransferase [Acidimicrobiales bacterium]|nr:glycosyltransferase [Acidimicrobiales bacterium]
MSRTARMATWLPAAAWTYLLVGHGRFWDTAVRLPRSPDPAGWPPVAVVVPARDEADLVGRTVATLLRQDYPGEARVVLVDDRSTDGTAAAAEAAAGTAVGAGHAGRLPLRVVAGSDRPDGWVGKLWALHQGVEAAASARPAPEWVLFTDADIAHPPDSLRRLVAAAVADQRDVVSLMARLRTDTGWERLVVPAFVYFFGLLYPFRRVARPGRTAAAAGGCLLVRAEALQRAGGVASVSDAVIDDVALARRVAETGGRLWLGLADDVCSVRPYPRLGDLWRMVSRSAYTQLRHSPALLAATVAGLIGLFGAPVGLLTGGLARRRLGAAAAGAVPCALMTATYLPTVRYHGLSPRWALTLPAAAVMYGAMTVDSARRHRTGRGVEWKGRRYVGA